MHRTLLVFLFTAFLLHLPFTALAGLNQYFVSTEWLADNQSNAVILDVRKAPLYLLGHIEGAHNVDRDEFLSTRNGVKSLIPTTSELETLLGRLGITRDTVIVAYANDDDPYAARLVWTLHSHGHHLAYVLDGGYDKWSLEGRPTAMLPTAAPQPATYVAALPRDLRADVAQVKAAIDNRDALIWDTRRPEEYAGTEVRADRGGHIPGATHLHWEDLQKEVNSVKVLKNEEEIRALLTKHGIGPEREIIPHCQTGIRSSYATLVLLGLGYERVRNYDGSWIEWANDPQLPVALPVVTAKAN